MQSEHSAAQLPNCIPKDTINHISIRKTDEYERWFRGLKNGTVRARINARIRRCQLAGRPVGDIAPTGGGTAELRFDFGPGYRVYFAHKQGVLMLLLAGGTKRGQQRDIERARKMLAQLKEDGQW